MSEFGSSLWATLTDALVCHVVPNENDASFYQIRNETGYNLKAGGLLERFLSMSIRNRSHLALSCS